MQAPPLPRYLIPRLPFFYGWVVLGCIFVYFLVPETKGVPMERMHALFARHPLWKRVMGPAADEIIKHDEKRMDDASISAASDAVKTIDD